MKRIVLTIVITALAITVFTVGICVANNKNNPPVTSYIGTTSIIENNTTDVKTTDFIGLKGNDSSLAENKESLSTEIYCQYPMLFDSYFIITTLYSPNFVPVNNNVEVTVKVTETDITASSIIQTVTTEPIKTTSSALITEPVTTPLTTKYIPLTTEPIITAPFTAVTDKPVTSGISSPATSNYDLPNTSEPVTTESLSVTLPETTTTVTLITTEIITTDSPSGGNDPIIIDQGGLLNIDDPDPNYGDSYYELADWERDLLAHLIMGEQGNHGKIGAALVAQCIKDALLVRGIYENVEDVRVRLSYQASLNYVPNEDVYWAIDYIFDQGKYAVKHPILYFYDFAYYESHGIDYSNIWHESQEFVVQYGTHRYFWRIK